MVFRCAQNDTGQSAKGASPKTPKQHPSLFQKNKLQLYLIYRLHSYSKVQSNFFSIALMTFAKTVFLFPVALIITDLKENISAIF